MKIVEMQIDRASVPEGDRKDILDHLQRILQSLPFRNSKRYPQLLQHCVSFSLAGDTEKLRERQLGVDLFGKKADYDTSADPIVRVTAAEVRKRLTQYYDGAGGDDLWIIELPSGSYTARFFRADSRAPLDSLTLVDSHAAEQETPYSTPSVSPKWNRPRESGGLSSRPAALTLGMLALLIGFGIAGWIVFRKVTVSPLWEGMIRANEPMIVVMGQLRGMAGPSDLPLDREIFRPEGFVSVDGANSAISLCSSLARQGGACRLMEAPKVSIADIQSRPVILIGAYNNSWALRVADELPYRFGPLDCKCILEARTGRRVGVVNFSLPKSRIMTDYSIVAHFHSHVTDGSVLIVAGVGPMSTKAAAEFVSSPDNAGGIRNLAPGSWSGSNFEIVLATEIVDGIPAHTHAVQSSFW